ncbi:hypothetical protein NE237_009331 [Protea cynaroides]|uniref:Uncharacterized protein n=1 Tax=Protea cynaroides TaxID=273540 RepID=A0A9Q0KXL7_9MAGN|nr:hypothetical protein NE237_009331 [Protea cynaroides]
MKMSFVKRIFKLESWQPHPEWDFCNARLVQWKDQGCRIRDRAPKNPRSQDKTHHCRIPASFFLENLLGITAGYVFPILQVRRKEFKSSPSWDLAAGAEPPAASMDQLEKTMGVSNSTPETNDSKSCSSYSGRWVTTIIIRLIPMEARAIAQMRIQCHQLVVTPVLYSLPCSKDLGDAPLLLVTPSCSALDWMIPDTIIIPGISIDQIKKQLLGSVSALCLIWSSLYSCKALANFHWTVRELLFIINVCVVGKMLQWMGGSRRKVATSRKSTERRQRQYFEQRKLQKQTAGLGNYADEINPYGQQVQLHNKPRSLDILSLLNLKTVTEESKSGCTTENVPFQVDVESPKKIFSSVPDCLPSPRNHSSEGNGDKLDYWRTATENQFSILDVLGDVGPNNNAEESPVREAHVAFSVKGLGKVGMETPVCSPRPSGRLFYNGCSSPPMDVKRFRSSKDFKYSMDDEELELNDMIHDINMPFGGKSSKVPLKSRNTMHHSGNLENKKFTFQGCMQPDAHGNQFNYFPGEEEYLYNNMGNIVDERKYGVRWGNRSETESDFNCLFGNKKQTHQTISAFEDSLHGIRDADRAVCNFNILGSPSLHFEDPASDKEIFFVTKEKSRYPSLDGSWEFSTGTDQPAWPFMTEDVVDSMSLLSEESCSSSAGSFY